MSESSKKQKRIHIITLGDHMVGKTSILKRFNGEEFNYDTYPTIGVDFVFKSIKIGSETISLKLWDTAGQERFNTITNSFYKQCQGALLVFDVGCHKSFEDIRKWISSINANTNYNVIKYLIGNKIDTEKIEVQKEEIQELVEEYEMKYFETSARSEEHTSEL